MNKKKIITLAIVLLALVGVLALVMTLPDADDKTGGSVDSDAASVSYGEKIYTASIDSIKRVSVSYSGSQYSFHKSGYDWLCPEKPGISISQSLITSLAVEIASLKYQDKLDTSSVTPADCGITDSGNRVTFVSDIGEVTIFLGSDVANSNLCYAMTTLSDDIYMVKKEDVSRMSVPFDAYRNVSFERIDFEKITSVTYSCSGVKFSLEKGDFDKNNADYYAWKMTSPYKIPARDEEVDKLLIKPITEIFVDAYVSDDGNFSAFGINGDNFVSYTDQSGKKQTVLFSSLINNKYYLAIEGDKTIYEVSRSCVPFYGINLIDFADRHLYLNKQANIDKVVIEGDGVKYTVKFADGAVVIDDKKVEKSSIIRDTFSYVCGLLADDIGNYTMGSTKLKITYELKDGTEAVLLFADADERYYTVSKNGQPLYLILKNKVQSLLDFVKEHKE